MKLLMLCVSVLSMIATNSDKQDKEARRQVMDLLGATNLKLIEANFEDAHLYQETIKLRDEVIQHILSDDKKNTPMLVYARYWKKDNPLGLRPTFKEGGLQLLCYDADQDLYSVCIESELVSNNGEVIKNRLDYYQLFSHCIKTRVVCTLPTPAQGVESFDVKKDELAWMKHNAKSLEKVIASVAKYGHSDLITRAITWPQGRPNVLLPITDDTKTYVSVYDRDGNKSNRVRLWITETNN